MNQLIYAFLSHTHCWCEVGMLKVPAMLGADDEMTQISIVMWDIDVAYLITCRMMHGPSIQLGIG